MKSESISWSKKDKSSFPLSNSNFCLNITCDIGGLKK